jgi:hypothetical protein
VPALPEFEVLYRLCRASGGSALDIQQVTGNVNGKHFIVLLAILSFLLGVEKAYHKIILIVKTLKILKYAH